MLKAAEYRLYAKECRASATQIGSGELRERLFTIALELGAACRPTRTSARAGPICFGQNKSDEALATRRTRTRRTPNDSGYGRYPRLGEIEDRLCRSSPVIAFAIFGSITPSPFPDRPETTRRAFPSCDVTASGSAHHGYRKPGSGHCAATRRCSPRDQT